MPEPAASRRLLRIPETAERLGLHERTVERLIARGELPAVKLGSRRNAPVRVDEAELDAWIYYDRPDADMSRGWYWSDGAYQAVPERTYPGTIGPDDELRGSPHELSRSDIAALRLWAEAERSEMVVRCGDCPGGDACCRLEPRRGFLATLLRRRSKT